MSTELSEFENLYPKPKEPADYSYHIQYDTYHKDLVRWNENKNIWLAALKWIRNHPQEGLLMTVIDNEIEKLEKE